METTPIIEPVGPCPLTGYPLVAVHDVSGRHAGLALADLAEFERSRANRSADARLRIEQVASASELFRSWAELLLLALHERMETAPERAEADYRECLDLVQTRHHYDTARIVASVHVNAVEHLRVNKPWTKNDLALVPDVGLSNVRTAAQTAVRRISGPDANIAQAVERLRGTYLQRLAEAC